MKEYIVYTKPSWRKISYIYNHFLKNDINWFYLQYKEDHKYFYRIRTSEKLKGMEEYIRKNKWNFTVMDYSSLSECGKVVEKYFDDFIPIFHFLSVLSLKGHKDGEEIRERVIHLLYNMHGFNYAEEAKDLTEIGLMRMFVAGEAYYKEKYSK